MDLEKEFSTYETKIKQIELTHERAQSEYNQKLKVLKQHINELTSLCEQVRYAINEEETGKCIAIAETELAKYYTAFNMKFETVPFGGEDLLLSLYEKLDVYIKQIEKEKQELLSVQKEKEAEENSYKKERAECIGKMRQKYQEYADGFRCLKDLKTAFWPSSDDVVENLFLGNSLKIARDALTYISESTYINTPILDEIKRGNSLFFDIDEPTNEVVSKVLIAMLINNLEAFPYGKLAIGIINYTASDYLNAIQNALSKSEALVSNTVYDMHGIDQLVTEVTKKCESINTKLLQNDCSDIYELYNKGINTEKCHLIVIKDALRDISEANLRHIYSWVTTYKKCGIRVIIADKTDEDSFTGKSNNFKNYVKRIRESCLQFSFKNGRTVDYKSQQVELIQIADDNIDSDIYQYCKQYLKSRTSTKSTYISYEQIGFDNNAEKNSTSIMIPIAYCAPNVWNIEFHCTAQMPLANLIVGNPGTGKSRLIDAIVLNGAIKYSPDELIFHLLDFKQGVSSDAYLTDCKIPHVKVVSSQNTPEDAEIILSSILKEQENRANKFKNYGVDNISGYNQISAQLMPRLIIVIDECQHIFDDEQLAKKCEQIVREGRAFGIHLVLATQTITQTMMKTIKFVDGRYCFEVTQADAEQLLNREYSKRLAEISKPTHRIFVTDYRSGEREIIKIEPAFDGDFDNSRTHRSSYAKRIREKWNTFPIDVFEVGNTDPFVFEQAIADKSERLNGLKFYLGQNIQDQTDLLIGFEREKQNALFLVSSKTAITENIMTSLMAQIANRNIDTRIINGMGNKLFGMALDSCRSDSVVSGNELDYLKVLNEIYVEYLSRMKSPNDDYAPIIFMINGLQNIIDFTNNTKSQISASTSSSNDSLPSDHTLTYQERRALRAKESGNSSAIQVYGKNTFFELLSNCYRVGIFIICCTDSIQISNSSGGLLSSSDKNIIKQCKYKIIDSEVGEDIRWVMEGTFKEKMLAKMNENMCLMSERQKYYSKFKYVQFENVESVKKLF